MLNFRTNLILLVLVVGIFIWALFELFSLRFERGDTYAPYSSYRAAPTGCKVLYESLNSMKGLQVKRLLRPIDEIEDVSKTVMLITNVSEINHLSAPGLESYVQRGGNVLIFCAPLEMNRAKYLGSERTRSTPVKLESEPEKDIIDKSKKAKKESAKDDETCKCDGGKGDKDDKICKSTGGLSKLLDKIMLIKRKYPHQMPIPAQANEQLKALSLPEINIYSHAYLELDGTSWEELYRAREKTMMVKAKYGRGTVIVSAASYFISNEAMLKEPPVELYAWLIGNRPGVIFNELVHGQGNTHNIAWLAGKYRLGLLLFNLLLVVVLYVWRSFFSSANIQQEKYKSRELQISSTVGLEKLLRKNISLNMCLPTCLDEWRKQKALTLGKQSDEELLQDTDPSGWQLNVDYNKIVKIINKQ
jgi:Domain of unknown function (DUF4350)